MKTSSSVLAVLAAVAFAFSPLAVQAQDQPPPPADYNAQQQPPPADMSAPPPPDDSGGGAPPPDASGDDNSGASFQQFYDQLGSQGQWVQTDNYGYAFQPTVTDPNWAPYTEGHWVYTDQGWTWASDEPWGWATYHYGRWVNIDGTGWCWVPGYTWAPAWVSWRYGGGYCGWAPLPPATLIGVDFAEPGINIGIGFSFGSDCDTAFGIGPGCYNFLPEAYIGEPYYHGYYLDRGRNFVVINNTRNVTNIRYYSGRSTFRGVNAGGPNFADVNAHARTHLQQVRLAEAGQAGRSSISNGALNVYAPHFNPATVRQARPATIARTVTDAKVNRGTSINHPLAVNAGLKPAAPSADTIRAAEGAQRLAPANAHIATAKTVPKTTFAKPLNTMQTASEVRRTMPASTTGAVNRSVGVQNENGGQYKPNTVNANAGQERTQKEQGYNNTQQTTVNQAQAEAAERERTAATQRSQTQSEEAAQRERERTATSQQAQAETAERERTAATERSQTQSEEAAQRERERTAASQQAQALQRERTTPNEQYQSQGAQHAPSQQSRVYQEERTPVQHAPVQQQQQQQRAPATEQRTAPQGGGNNNNNNGNANGNGNKNKNNN